MEYISIGFSAFWVVTEDLPGLPWQMQLPSQQALAEPTALQLQA